MTATHSTLTTVLVAINISKHRHEVLIGIPGKKCRSHMTITDTLEDFQRLSPALTSYNLPVRIGFEATGNFHRALAHHLGLAGFYLKLIFACSDRIVSSWISGALLPPRSKISAAPSKRAFFH